MDQINGIPIRRRELVTFCRKNRIKALSLFGSITRNDFGKKSDVDVLVEFEKGGEPGLIRVSQLERELSVLFDGRKVDLRTPDDLSRYFRDEVIAKKVVLYAAS